jgi:hypothetical protein
MDARIEKIIIIIIPIAALAAILAISYTLSEREANHLLVSLPVSIIIVVSISYVHLKLKKR